MPYRNSNCIDAVWLLFAARLAILASLVISLTVAVAWLAGWQELHSLLHGLPTMKFNTSLSLALLSVAALECVSIQSNPARRAISILLVFFVLVLGIATLAQNALGMSFGIDTAIVSDPASQALGLQPGRMSPGTVSSVALVATSIVLLTYGRQVTGMIVAIVAMVKGCVPIIFYIFDMHSILQKSIFSTTALHTAILLFFLSAGLLLGAVGRRQAAQFDASIYRAAWRSNRGMFSAVLTTTLLGVAVTIFASLTVQANIEQTAKLLFEHASEQVTYEIQRHVYQPVYGICGARGVYAASNSVERKEFLEYVASRNLPHEFPGAQGIGMIRRVMRSDLEDFIRTEQADDAPDFAVQTDPESKELFLVEHIYPLSTNRPEWGYDMGRDAVRLAAINQAINSGLPTISGEIRLRQTDRENDAILMLVPVYSKGNVPRSPQERQTRLIGVLYSPIILTEAIQAMETFIGGDLEFDILDNQTGQMPTVLYDHDNYLDEEKKKPKHATLQGRMFTTQLPLKIGGRKWSIVTNTTPAFEARVNRTTPALIAVGGLILSVLLSGIFWALGLSRSRARGLAFQMTTEARASEEAARKAAAEMEVANRAKSEFLANMSHEIRTPMTSILGFTDLLLSQESSESLSEDHITALETIKRNGDQLLSLINDILDVSKIEAGKLGIEIVETSPFEVVDNVIELLAQSAKCKGVKIETVFETPIPEYIYTDPTRLKQILLNLAGNALKFTQKGFVRISVAFSQGGNGDSRISFRVRDTGIGMSPEQLEQIRRFEAFHQADTSTTRKFGGTGLGLRIATTLAQMLGGKLEVDSEWGTGSTFTATISPGDVTGVRLIELNQVNDRDSHKSKRTAASGTIVSEAPLANVRILLAEDGLDNQRLISFVLQKAGATISIVGNGRLAVEALTIDGDLASELQEDSPYDIILMDMQMPELDGYAAANLLRLKECRIPIIALTAHVMSGEREKCLANGCDDYATKPIDHKRLIEQVQTLAKSQFPIAFA